MGYAEARAVRIKYHALKLELTKKRDADLKLLNQRQKEEVSETYKRHRAEDRALKDKYVEDYQDLDARMLDAIEGAQR